MDREFLPWEVWEYGEGDGTVFIEYLLWAKQCAGHLPS